MSTIGKIVAGTIFGVVIAFGSIFWVFCTSINLFNFIFVFLFDKEQRKGKISSCQINTKKWLPINVYCALWR